MLFQAKLHWVISTLTYITSPWETWSLHSCEESKARKQTRKSTGRKFLAKFKKMNLIIVNYYLRMFYTYIISNLYNIYTHISYRIYTYTTYIISSLYLFTYIIYIYIYIHLCSLLLLLFPFQLRVGLFFPLVDGWIILPRLGRFLHCKDLRYLNKTVKWLEATQLSSTYPCLEHNIKNKCTI